MQKIRWKSWRDMPSSERRITISTIITLMRVFLAPCVVSAMIMHQWGMACILFTIASLTDFLDGNLARFLNEQTFLGACLDPLADKILLIPCFATLAFIHTPLFSIPSWFVGIVLIRELLVVIGAWYLYTMCDETVIVPSFLSKLTTTAQMGFIMWLFACYFFHWVPVKTYYTMLGLVLFLVIASLMHYAYVGYQQLKG